MMNKEYFTEKINDETLALLIDRTLNFEKKQKAEKSRTNFMRIIPAAAVFLLIIGLINLMPMFSFIIPDTSIFTPGAGRTNEQPPSINIDGENYILDSDSNFYVKAYAGIAEVSTYDELAQAIKTAKTIYVSGIIDIAEKSDLQIADVQEIHILPDAELNIYDYNFFVRGDIINEGIIKVYGRMLLFNEPIEYGVIENIKKSGTTVLPEKTIYHNISGETIYYRGDITVAEMKRILNGDLPYTGITIAPGMAGTSSYECVPEDRRDETYILVIDEDYILPDGKSMWLNGQTTLKVAENVTFTVNGRIETYNAPIIEGEMISNMDAQYNLPLTDNDGNIIGKTDHYTINNINENENADDTENITE